MAFEKEINDYENLRTKYQTVVVDRMDREEYRQFNEILFSTHSCAIEGNSFSVDDTRELKEKGLGMIPTGKSLSAVMHRKGRRWLMRSDPSGARRCLLRRMRWIRLLW